MGVPGGNTHGAIGLGFDSRDGVPGADPLLAAFQQVLNEETVALGPGEHGAALLARPLLAGGEVEEPGPGAGGVEPRAEIIPHGVIQQPEQTLGEKAAGVQPCLETEPIQGTDLGGIRSLGARQREGLAPLGISPGHPAINFLEEGVVLTNILFPFPGVKVEPFPPLAMEEDPLVGAAHQVLFAVDGLALDVIALYDAAFVQQLHQGAHLLGGRGHVVGRQRIGAHAVTPTAGGATDLALQLQQPVVPETLALEMPGRREPRDAAPHDHRADGLEPLRYRQRSIPHQMAQFQRRPQHLAPEGKVARAPAGEPGERQGGSGFQQGSALHDHRFHSRV